MRATTSSSHPGPSHNGSPQNQRAKILVLVHTYLPGYKGGGPVRSIENLVITLGSEFDFRIVTSDRDLDDKVSYPNIVVNHWVKVGPASVMYLRPGLRGLFGLSALLRSVDRDTVLYLNSFFGRRFSILPVFLRWLKLCKPRFTILAPRGEFSMGAVGDKRKRKQTYLAISRWLGLHRGICWHASSEFEANDVRAQFPLIRTVEVGSVPDVDSARTHGTSLLMTASDMGRGAAWRPLTRTPKSVGRLRIVCVARCSRMKNLLGALRMLASLKGDISFDIYGPQEDKAYWNECQRLITELPPNISVQYKGEIEHQMVCRVFSEYDLFLFPTLGENYGHVICEALTSGCPVLISDRTPWRNLEAEGVGWDIPLSETERFVSTLQQCVYGSEEWFAEMSRRAAEYAVERILEPSVIEANRRLFELASMRRFECL